MFSRVHFIRIFRLHFFLLFFLRLLLQLTVIVLHHGRLVETLVQLLVLQALRVVVDAIVHDRVAEVPKTSVVLLRVCVLGVELLEVLVTDRTRFAVWILPDWNDRDFLFLFLF